MGEFFGKPTFGTPQGVYSWQHLLYVSFLMVVMVLLAIFIGSKCKDKDDKSKNLVLIWCAFLINGFEMFKFAFNLGASSDGSSWKEDLPLYLCRVQLIAIPLAAFCKGRVKEAALDFVVVFGIIGSILGTFGSTENFNTYPVLSFYNVISGITHSISGFASLYIMISKMDSMKLKNWPIVITVLLSVCGLALLANHLFDENYMFLSYHDDTPYIIVHNIVGGIQVLYSAMVIILFVVYYFIFIYVYNLIKNKISSQTLA
jgi:uncharacterized membrane protein YwaF